jgi:hypothetical protein
MKTNIVLDDSLVRDDCDYHDLGQDPGRPGANDFD